MTDHFEKLKRDLKLDISEDNFQEVLANFIEHKQELWEAAEGRPAWRRGMFGALDRISLEYELDVFALSRTEKAIEELLDANPVYKHFEFVRCYDHVGHWVGSVPNENGWTP